MDRDEKSSTPVVRTDVTKSSATSAAVTGIDQTAEAPFVVASQDVLLGHTAAITQVRFSSDGARLATASKDGSLRIWNVVDAFPQASPSLPLPIQTTSSNPAGGGGSGVTGSGSVRPSITAGGGSSKSVSSATPTPPTTGATLHSTYYHSAELLSVDWDHRSGNDSFVLFGSGDGKVKLYSVHTKRVVSEFDVGVSTSPPPAAPAASLGGGDKASAAAAAAANNSANALAVTALDTSRGADAFVYNRVLDVAASPTDPLFVCAVASKYHDTLPGGRGILESWSLQTGKRVQSFRVESSKHSHSAQVNCVVYNHNGNMLVTGGCDGMIRVFDVGKTDVPIMGWAAHTGGDSGAGGGGAAGGTSIGGGSAGGGVHQVSSVRFSSDETSIISTGLDGIVAEWSLHRVGKLVRSYKIPQHQTYRTGGAGGAGGTVTRCELAVDADAEYLLLSSSHAFSWAAPYSVASGRTNPIQAITGHAGAVLSVDWHPVTHQIVTGSADHTARLTTLIPRRLASTSGGAAALTTAVKVSASNPVGRFD